MEIPFNDGSHIIYVNGKYKNDADPVGKLMHDFRCTDAVDMFYQEIARSVAHFKETEGGQEHMCQIMEELCEKERYEEKVEIALRLIAMGKLSFEEIAEGSGLPVETIGELAKRKSA